MAKSLFVNVDPSFSTLNRMINPEPSICKIRVQVDGFDIRLPSKSSADRLLKTYYDVAGLDPNNLPDCSIAIITL